MSSYRFGKAFALLVIFAFCSCVASAQTTTGALGSIKGSVSGGQGTNAYRIHNANVLLQPGNRSVRTNHSGEFEFRNLDPGSYLLIAHSPGLADERRQVQVTAGQTSLADISMRLASVHEEVTVTATGRQQSTLEAIPSTTSVGSIELVQNAHTSLGEVLDHEPGVSQRGFGPGSSRPVIRGFTADRVLVMQDGLTAGGLGSQSGDHGEPVDVLELERVEIVRGPATLLYGSSAIGGVVNTISGNFDHDEHPHEGWSGYATGLGGTTNAQGGGGGAIRYGFDHWRLWAGGSGQRTGDYDTPIGTIANSRTRSGDGFGGFGYSDERKYFDLGYNYDNRKYGIPFGAFLESGGTTGPEDENINIRMQTHNWKVNTGVRNLEGPISGVDANFGFIRYRHGEFEGEEEGTKFKNDQFNYRLVANQAKYGKLSGSFGISGIHRAFESIGDEALAPPTDQNSFSAFTLQALDFSRISFQFGGRFEHAGYSVDQSVLPARRNRDFNGGSAAFGTRIPLWEGGSLIANYTHSFRAPALEELYNNGPHPGNLAFEVGDDSLKAEQGDGIDLSLRHHAGRFSGSANFFAYHIDNFIFLAPTGNIEDGLFENEYLQGPTRYIGGEVEASFDVRKDLSLNAAMDIVNAELTSPVFSPITGISTPANTSLPRIPPLRGRVGFEYRYKGLSIQPQAIMSSSQDNVFVTETRTPGYTVINIGASYTVARAHAAHVFSVNSFNLGDRLYRNHLSFIKDLAPEIGRGVRFSYTVRFF
jgi:iron complex outermembrane receptor protein